MNCINIFIVFLNFSNEYPEHKQLLYSKCLILYQNHQVNHEGWNSGVMRRDDTIQNTESNLQIEHGITDFWTQNSSYKMLIESYGIAKMDSRELKIAINKNLQKLFGSEFNYDIKICQLFNDNANIFCNETNGNESKIQIFFMWRFLHYWPKSIAA